MRLQSCRPILDEECGFDEIAAAFSGSQPSVAQCMVVTSVMMESLRLTCLRKIWSVAQLIVIPQTGFACSGGEGGAGWMDGSSSMDGWMDGWMVLLRGWMDGWMDGWRAGLDD